jgi:hypothetical protein
MEEQLMHLASSMINQLEYIPKFSETRELFEFEEVKKYFWNVFKELQAENEANLKQNGEQGETKQGQVQEQETSTEGVQEETAPEEDSTVQEVVETEAKTPDKQERETVKDVREPEKTGKSAEEASNSRKNSFAPKDWEIIEKILATVEETKEKLDLLLNK